MARMRKYGESKTTRIMLATAPHVTSGLGLRKFQADGFLLTRVYTKWFYLQDLFQVSERKIFIWARRHSPVYKTRRPPPFFIKCCRLNLRNA